jgi:hypothetical protein
MGISGFYGNCTQQLHLVNGIKQQVPEQGTKNLGSPMWVQFPRSLLLYVLLENKVT